MVLRRLPLAIVSSALVGVAALCAQSPETRSPEAPTAGLLLLKNGKTLAGTISRTDDRYYVVTPEAELQIRAADVTAVCHDVEEAYARRLETINLRSGDARVEMAQWCIDRDLFGHAARELAEAFRIDDLNPRIALVERRLKSAMAEPKPTPTVAEPTPMPAVSDEELEQTARSVPHDLMQEFTTRVQPLLVNYCATAGCHGPRPTSSFALERIYLNQPSDPRQIRLNLRAVLSQIDKRQPAQSRLLTAPISPHGGAKKPIFSAYNADHYRQLASWAVRAAAATAAPRTAQGAAPATIPSAESPLLQRLPIAPPRESVPPVGAPSESSP